MKQSEEYRSRHSMEVPGKSTEVPGGCTEVPDNCQELPWSRKKSLYGCHENAAWQQLTDRQLRRMAIEQIRVTHDLTTKTWYLVGVGIVLSFCMSLLTTKIYDQSKERWVKGRFFDPLEKI